MVNMIVDMISNINKFIWGYPFLILLLFTGVYLTIKLKLPQFKVFFSMWEILKRPKDKDKNKITSFKSLMTVLAGTLGTGNITGIASAIIIGGIGSLFWLFVSGIFAIAVSYTENYIVLMNRKSNKQGYYGGAMYVLDEVLDKRKLAIVFSVFVAVATIGIGSMVQSNSLSSMLYMSTGMSKKAVGIILSLITCYIVFGGKYRLAKISSVIIPICTMLYILLCTYIIIKNKVNILPAINSIIDSAFGAKQVIGGVVGLSISQTIGVGFSRGMFSNEAGMGSAPMFSATVEENNLEKQARFAAMSVIIDTLIVCSLTGITMAVSEKYYITDISLFIKEVFQMAPFGNAILTICMIFFVIATIPCWEFYGEQAIKYLFKNNISIILFRIIYISSIYVGCISLINVVWDISGIANALMALPNLYMIFKMARTIE